MKSALEEKREKSWNVYRSLWEKHQKALGELGKIKYELRQAENELEKVEKDWMETPKTNIRKKTMNPASVFEHDGFLYCFESGACYDHNGRLTGYNKTTYLWKIHKGKTNGKNT